VLAIALVVSACAAPPFARDESVENVVNAYRQQSGRAQTSSRGIHALSVEPVADKPGQFLVTAMLERAPLELVIRRLLAETQTPHVVLAQSLAGRVSGRFEKVPMPLLLRNLLEANGYTTTERDGLLVIAEASVPPGDPATAPTVWRGVPLRHLDIETVTKFLDGLFPVEPRTGARPIAWASQPYTSSIFLSGPAPAVARAVQLLDEMDRDPGHVIIEVLVVEFDTSEFERLGSDLINFKNQQLGPLATAVGGALTPGLAGAASTAMNFLFTEGANNPLSFQAVIEVLAQRDKARVIARPYMASVSGKQAAIAIQRERTVAVVSGVNNQITSDTQTIPSGVILTITPFVLDDNRVRLDVEVEQSGFIEPQNPTILIEKDANKAKTTMQVRTGQSAVIGGLALQEAFSSNAGLPWLRYIPLLNLALAKHIANDRKQDVMVFVTPYVWTPAIVTPFPDPDAFKTRDEDELTAIEKWKRRWIKP
jgi:type II secretory pathway component GspD/PulD (secretin)